MQGGCEQVESAGGQGVKPIEKTERKRAKSSCESTERVLLSDTEAEQEVAGSSLLPFQLLFNGQQENQSQDFWKPDMKWFGWLELAVFGDWSMTKLMQVYGERQFGVSWCAERGRR